MKDFSRCAECGKRGPNWTLSHYYDDGGVIGVELVCEGCASKHPMDYREPLGGYRPYSTVQKGVKAFFQYWERYEGYNINYLSRAEKRAFNRSAQRLKKYREPELRWKELLSYKNCAAYRHMQREGD